MICNGLNLLQFWSAGHSSMSLLFIPSPLEKTALNPRDPSGALSHWATPLYCSIRKACPYSGPQGLFITHGAEESQPASSLRQVARCLAPQVSFLSSLLNGEDDSLKLPMVILSGKGWIKKPAGLKKSPDELTRVPSCSHARRQMHLWKP